MDNELRFELSDNSPLAAMLEEIAERLETGESVDLDQYISQHPDLEPELRRLMPALEALVIVGKSPLQSKSDSVNVQIHREMQLGQLGDYQLIREIGRGGMGVVYEAKQLSLQRRVALKILPFASVLDKQHLQRFKNESLVAATLDHRHIVSVYSVGTDRGVHHYAMQFVDGQSLAEVITELHDDVQRGLETEQRVAGEATSASCSENTRRTLQAHVSTVRSGRTRQHYLWVAKLGIQAAHALAYAHEQGVLHRDIKPGNLMLDQDGELLLTDFGLARVKTSPELTMTGDLLGTLRYASPEQALGRRSEIGEHSDIYSLGATLYELATLRPMFANVDRQELLSAIAEQEPLQPRAIQPDLPQDLETILLKATSKEIGQRYTSAEQLADDMLRFCNNRPIRARRPSLIDRIGKWSRRHQPLVATLILALAGISLVLGMSTLLINRARSRANTAFVAAEENAEQLADLLYATDMQLAYQAWEKGWDDQAQVILNRQKPEVGARDRRGFEWQLLHGLVRMPAHFELVGHKGAIHEMAVFPDGRRVATVGEDATLRIWDIPNRELISIIPVGQEGLHSVAISPDGQHVAVGNKKLYLIDVGSKKVREILEAERTIESLAFNLGGDRIAAGIRYLQVDLVSLEGKVVSSVESDARHEILQFMPKSGVFLMPSRNESRRRNESRGRGVLHLRSNNLSDMIRVVDHNIAEVKSAISTFAFSSCEQFIATGNPYDPRISICRAATGELLAYTPSVRSRITSIAFSPADNSITAAYNDGLVRTWQCVSDKDKRLWVNPRAHVISAHDGSTTMVRYLNSSTLLTAGVDGILKVWSQQEHKTQSSIGPSNAGVQDISFSPEGDRLVLSCGNSLSIIDRLDEEVFFHAKRAGNEFGSAAWSRDGNVVAVTSNSKGDVRLLDVRNGIFTKTLRHGNHVEDVDFSPEGSVMVSIGENILKIWDVDTGSEIKTHLLPEHGWVAKYSKNGDLLAYGGRFGRIILRNTINDQIAIELPCRNKTLCLDFSDDDNVLATGHEDGKIRIWDLTTGTLRTEFSGHERYVQEVSFRLNGDVLASAGQDGTIRLWNVSLDRAIGVLHQRENSICVHFSPCGNRLAAGFSRTRGRLSTVIWSIDDSQLAPGNLSAESK